MNNTDKLALELHELLVNSSEFQSYQTSLNNLKTNQKLYEIEKELKALQKQIIQEKKQMDNHASELISQYNELKAYFESHPLIVNYIEDKENLSLLCGWIKDLIEGCLDD